MSTIPAAAAATWAAHHPTPTRVPTGGTPDQVPYEVAGVALSEILAQHLVLVGVRPEVDLTSLAGKHPAAADDLGSWWESTRELWSAARSDRLSGRSWLRTRRTLVEDHQVTGKKDKRDLVELYTALTDPGPLSRIIIEATSADPDTKLVVAMAKALGGQYCRDPDKGAATLRVPMSGAMWWPDALGGPLWPGEISRDIEIGLRYAAWRDRRLRRVASVRVDVEELWADPAAHKDPYTQTPMTCPAASAQPASASR